MSFTPPPPHPIAIRNIGHYENVDKATLQGIEFEGKQRLGDQFTLRSTYTYLDAKNDMTGDRLIGRARHKLSLQIIYDDFKHGWSGVLWNDWLSDYYYAAEGRGGEEEYLRDGAQPGHQQEDQRSLECLLRREQSAQRGKYDALL